MSQENITCAKCDKSCGYDDDKKIWFGVDKKGDYHASLCGQCAHNLVARFCAFFGIEGISYSESTLDIDWDMADKILSKIKRDYTMRISYITTDKELYERTETNPVSVLD